jgi:hypothetical protein
MDMKKLQVAAQATKSFMDELNSMCNDEIFYTLENERNLVLFKTQPAGNFPAGYAKYGLILCYSVDEVDSNAVLTHNDVIDAIYFNNLEKLFRYVEDMLDVDAKTPLVVPTIKEWQVEVIGHHTLTIEAATYEEAVEKLEKEKNWSFDEGDFDAVEYEVDIEPLN